MRKLAAVSPTRTTRTLADHTPESFSSPGSDQDRVMQSLVAAQPARLGTAHRLETLRWAGVLDSSYGTVVDIGGYDGAICSHIRARKRIVVEPNPPKSDQIARGVELVRPAGRHMPIVTGSADLVLMTDVLEHVEEPEQLVSEALRLLKPSAPCVVTVPCRDIRIFPPFLQDWVDHRWDHTIRRGFTIGELDHIIRSAGGEVVRTIPLSSLSFRFAYLPLSIVWRLWKAPSRLLLMALTRLDFQLRNVGAKQGYIFCEFTRSTSNG